MKQMIFILSYYADKIFLFFSNILYKEKQIKYFCSFGKHQLEIRQ